jgi:D-glycero-alpha-D-manno-heptose 1-phosphate guanylyltransferase
MEAIILAGGLGTRLSSRLSDLPKAMAPVAGRPFLEILLNQLLNAGCNRVILSVGHRRQAIIQTFGDSFHGMPLHYVIETAPLGTGGAIRLSLQHARENSVLVLNGDTFLDVNFADMLSLHKIGGSPMTLAVTKVQEMGRYGGVRIDGQHVVGFIEKGQNGPGWINGGVYAMNRDFPWPESLPSQFSFELDVLANHLDRLHPGVFECFGKFLDIGTPEDLDRAQIELALVNRKPADN